jgi:AraC family transcriptional regulator
MSEFLRSQTLHATPLVQITDFSCRAPASSCGGDECASSHHVLFTRTGVFVKHAAGRRVVAESTQALFFNHREAFRVSHPLTGGDDCTIVSCPASVWLELVGSYDPRVADRPEAPFTRSHASLAPQTLLRSRAVRHQVRRRAMEAIEVEEETLDLLDAVLCDTYDGRDRARSYVTARTSFARRELAEEARLEIAARSADNRSLLELARAVNSSPFHLSRVFREQVGVSIHQYRLRLRLALALDRLLDGSESLSGMAHSLGFSSHSHFTTVFRRTFGVSPSAFRRSRSTARVREVRTNLQA